MQQLVLYFLIFRMYQGRTVPVNLDAAVEDVLDTRLEDVVKVRLVEPQAAGLSCRIRNRRDGETASPCPLQLDREHPADDSLSLALD